MRRMLEASSAVVLSVVVGLIQPTCSVAIAAEIAQLQ